MFLKDGQASIEPRLAPRSQARDEIRRMPRQWRATTMPTCSLKIQRALPPLQHTQLASINEAIQAMRGECHYLQ
jgi:hypothetical protein